MLFFFPTQRAGGLWRRQNSFIDLNIADICIETPQHNFLECPLYLTHRDILLAYFRNTEAPLSLKNILYGDIQENMTKTLIAAVEQYICETQRFSILSLCE